MNTDGPGPMPVPAVCLVILDGWGLADPGPGNAISQADTPTFDKLWNDHPHTTLTAQGRAVVRHQRHAPLGQIGGHRHAHRAQPDESDSVSHDRSSKGVVRLG